MRVMTLVGVGVLGTVLSGCSLSTGTPPRAIQAPKETQVIQAPEETPEVKMRRATAQGQQLMQQAEQLSNQGTGESQKQAIASYEQALVIWRQIGARPAEAATLLSIGTLYFALHEYQKALGYSQQALAIQRELKNRAGEAIMLVSIGGAYDQLGKTQKALDAFTQALSLFHSVAERLTSRLYSASPLNRSGLMLSYALKEVSHGEPQIVGS